jgi:hypothetical protein
LALTGILIIFYYSNRRPVFLCSEEKLKNSKISFPILIIIFILLILPWTIPFARRNLVLFGQVTLSSVLGKSYTFNIQKHIRENLQRLNVINPQSPEIALSYAIMEDNPQLAVDAIRRSLESNQYDLYLNYYYGLILLGATGLGVEPEYEEARNVFLKIQSLNPNNGAINFHTAQAFLFMKDTVRAVEELKQAVQKEEFKFYYVDMTYKVIKNIRDYLNLTLFDRMVLFISIDLERFDAMTSSLITMLPKIDETKIVGTTLVFTEEELFKAELLYKISVAMASEVNNSMAAEVAAAILRQDAAKSVSLVSQAFNQNDKSISAKQNSALANKHRYILNQLMPESFYLRYKDRGYFWLLIYLAIWQGLFILPIYLLLLKLLKKQPEFGIFHIIALIVPLIGLPIYWIIRLIRRQPLVEKSKSLSMHITLATSFMFFWMLLFWIGIFAMKPFQDKVEKVQQLDIFTQEFAIPMETHSVQDLLGLDLY